ncbi:MAG: DUF1924 domain-containing protein [Magnetococcales bacterium]|nr:DUF1924 domain-containing protein [Magnetococcales bacterium]
MHTHEQTVSVWDPLLRLCHWGLVLGVILAFVTEDEVMFLHVMAGYWILGLVIFRLVWGFMGPGHARFSTFVRGPRQILAYMRSILGGRPEHYLGHNPAGGGMAIAILMVLSLTVILGMAAYDSKEFSGFLWPMTFGLGIGTVKLLTFLHEIFATLLLFLVGLHLVGVLVASLQHRENLIKSMLTGRKRAPLSLAWLLILGMGVAASPVDAAQVDEILATYRSQSGTPFTAQRGAELLTRSVKDPEGGPDRSCATCHTQNPTRRGQHPKSGKSIDPLAPSANPERLTDAAKVEKWFARNCEWTLGRPCTPQEKGDFLTYLKDL